MYVSPDGRNSVGQDCFEGIVSAVRSKGEGKETGVGGEKE